MNIELKSVVVGTGRGLAPRLLPLEVVAAAAVPRVPIKENPGVAGSAGAPLSLGLLPFSVEVAAVPKAAKELAVNVEPPNGVALLSPSAGAVEELAPVFRLPKVGGLAF